MRIQTVFWLALLLSIPTLIAISGRLDYGVIFLIAMLIGLISGAGLYYDELQEIEKK